MNSTVNGTVVKNGVAQPGMQVTFVSAAGQQLPVKADNTGRFHVTLNSGTWKVYTVDNAGRQTYHSDVTVRDSENRNVMLVSR